MPKQGINGPAATATSPPADGTPKTAPRCNGGIPILLRWQRISESESHGWKCGEVIWRECPLDILQGGQSQVFRLLLLQEVSILRPVPYTIEDHAGEEECRDEQHGQHGPEYRASLIMVQLQP
jgi:hypothetical protein